MEELGRITPEILRDDFTMDNLWTALLQRQNQFFYTARGLEFRYEIRGYEIFVDRKVNSKSITRSSVEIVFQKLLDRLKLGEKLPIIISGPKKLGVFGASYLYPVLLELGIIRKESCDEEKQQMELRDYRTSDLKEMTELFYHTVHQVNAADYTREQLDVWATGTVDLKEWDKSFLEHETCIAIIGEQIAGFGDMDQRGYLDRLYVHKDFQRRGIASAICDSLEKKVEASVFTTHASITARPFFEKRGYRVKKEQQVERGGILLANYVMEKII